MAFLLWSIVVLFYMYFGLLYLSIPQLSPLGAMAMPGISSELIFVFSLGFISVLLGYVMISSRKEKKKNISSVVNTDYFMTYSSFFYLLISVFMFAWGVQYYGGYIAFLRTPYVAIFSGSNENQIKDVLISTSGLLSIFSILSAFSVQLKTKANYLFILISLLILLSIFVQGRRETFLLLVMCFASYKFMGKGFSFKNVLKSFFIVISLLAFAGLGLYLRASSSTSGGSIFDAISYAVLYETDFTIANLANEIKIHTLNGIPFAGIAFLLYPILFIVPSFIFSILGYDKSNVFANNDPKIYDDKGGSFIFTGAYHSLGDIGVIVHGLLLGMLLAYFYRKAKINNTVFYHFPLVSLVLVASRKDLTYGIKYISLQFMMLFLFFVIYKFLPKKSPKRQRP